MPNNSVIKYQRAFLHTTELVLGYLFERCEDYAIKRFNKKRVYEEISDGLQLDRRKIYSVFSRLENSKYIEFKDNSITLTDKAKIKIVDKVVTSMPADKKHRFISFDIPERLHYKRDMFRRTIKRMGFCQIQQSLWVTDKNVGDLVDIAAREYKVEEYIAYLVVESTNIDKHIEHILQDNN